MNLQFQRLVTIMFFFFLIDIKGKDVNARHVGMVISSVKRIRKHGFYS